MITSHREKFKPTLDGFEHVKRHWDPKRKRVSAKILPGEFYVTVHDEIVSTILGSCVSACIRDPITGIGGMNHFMLPISREDMGHDECIEATRYGKV